MQLSSLIKDLAITRLPGCDGGDVRICDLTEDSRTVVPGSLFIARAGAKADGKAYVEAAALAGAVAVLTDDPSCPIPRGVVGLATREIALVTARLAERFYGEPSSRLKTALVTGTNGKTTVSTLLWQLMNHAARRCGLMGTVQIDDGVEVARAAMTTPPAIEVSRSLAVMVESGCEAVAMECSSHALDQRRCDALTIDVGVFTNLTGDHLDYHKTMDAYAGAKARLMSLIAPGGTAVLNADSPWAPMMARACRATIVSCNEVSPGASESCRLGPHHASVEVLE